MFDPSWGGPAGDIISTTADLDRFFRALLGGKLLTPDLLAEMQTTVAATEFQDEFTPGYRYGLGLAWNPLPCGGYWHHGGDTPGYHSREGFTTGGHRGVVVSSSTQQADEEPAAQQTITTLRLIEHALCAIPG